jgi:hypothetical protein
VPAAYPGSRGRIAQISRGGAAALARDAAAADPLPPRDLARRLLGFAAMATHVKLPSEGWTVPLHVIVWTAITVGFIMSLVVLMMH